MNNDQCSIKYFQDSLDSELPGKRGRGWKPSQGSYLGSHHLLSSTSLKNLSSGFHRPLGVVPPASPGHLHYPPSPSYFYSTPYYSPSHFYPDKLYQCWPPPPHHTYGGQNKNTRWPTVLNGCNSTYCPKLHEKTRQHFFP